MGEKLKCGQWQIGTYIINNKIYKTDVSFPALYQVGKPPEIYVINSCQEGLIMTNNRNIRDTYNRYFWLFPHIMKGLRTYFLLSKGPL